MRPTREVNIEESWSDGKDCYLVRCLEGGVSAQETARYFTIEEALAAAGAFLREQSGPSDVVLDSADEAV